MLATLARAPSHLGSQFFADITRHERGFGGLAPHHSQNMFQFHEVVQFRFLFR